MKQLCLLLTLCPALAHAAPVLDRPQTFEPLSRTAEAITGLITITQDAVVFGGNVQVDLQPLGERDGVWADAGNRTAAQLFRVASDPGTLLNGNTICGTDQPLRHLAVRQDESYGGWVLTLLAFGGNAEPQGITSPDLCGTYAYLMDGPVGAPE